MNRPLTVDPPSAEELNQDGPLQQRSLSLPQSRIVLNPQDFMSDASEVEQNCGPTMPLGLGYYAYDQATKLPQFLTVWTAAPGHPSTLQPLPASESVPVEGWSAMDDHVVVEDDGSAVTVSLSAGTDAGYMGTAATPVRLDPGLPMIRVAISAVEGQWTLQVRTADAEPVMILPGASALGLAYLDLRPYFPEGLSEVVEVVVGVIGSRASVTLDELRFIAAPESAEGSGTPHTTNWSAGGLGLSGASEGNAFQGIDAFVDADSVVRELTFSHPLSDETPLTIVGRYAGTTEVHAGVVVTTMPALTVAVSIPEGAAIRYFRDEAELAAGAEGSALPVAPVGVWAIQLRPGHAQYRIGVGTDPADAERAVARARTAGHADAGECRARTAADVDRLLAQLPHPVSFALTGVDPLDVTADDVRGVYYRAFVALMSNVLPPQPEIEFDYPTVATGKASMWNYGAPGARSAAAWETFLAIQFLGYVDSDLAWDCFHGLMSLVDDAGSLAGESLPSRKAQTAWVLFALTGEHDALAESYPALRRLLKWQAERPRWVYGTYDNPGEQDAEFLSSLIVDLEFGTLIATELGEERDADHFTILRQQLRASYVRNCFAGLERRAVQHWFPDGDTSIRGGADGGGLQVTMGLAITDLATAEVDSLLARFDEQYDPHQQLGGFDFVKHPNAGYTVSGLLQHGRERQAEALLNAMLRDVVRSGSFAEVYDRALDRPRPWGVRPSIFGMTQAIDAVWLNNGLRMDRGVPIALALPCAEGGVRGILVHGVDFTIEVGGGTVGVRDSRSGQLVRSADSSAAVAGIEFPVSLQNSTHAGRV